MKLSAAGILMLTELEGSRSTMYLDSANKPTIGVGHLITSNEQHLLTATLSGAQIRELLARDVVRFENAVNDCVRVPLEQSQFDALVMLTFNIGVGNAANDTGFCGSTVVERINAKDTEERITEAWKRWRIAGGKVDQGLINRRAKEIELYFTGAEKKSSNSTLSEAF
jgi:GH24 family phage-related lysozyme (muramidase)